MVRGYSGELNLSGRAIESDASTDVVHIDWSLTQARNHNVIACCIGQGQTLPEVRVVGGEEEGAVIELKLEGRVVSIPVVA